MPLAKALRFYRVSTKVSNLMPKDLHFSNYMRFLYEDKSGAVLCIITSFSRKLVKGSSTNRKLFRPTFFLSVVWANLFYGHNYFNVTITRWILILHGNRLYVILLGQTSSLHGLGWHDAMREVMHGCTS